MDAMYQVGMAVVGAVLLVGVGAWMGAVAVHTRLAEQLQAVTESQLHALEGTRTLITLLERMEQRIRALETRPE